MDFGMLCNEILMIDPKIRYAGICDETGETKYGGQREGVKTLLSSEKPRNQICKQLPDGLYEIRFLVRLERADTLWQSMKRLYA